MHYKRGGDIDSLDALCSRMGTNKFWPNGRAWHGEIADIRLQKRPTMLVQKLGYSVPEDYTFHEITLQVASRILAYLCRESLAYGKWTYRPKEALAIEAMLNRELGSSSRFWSNTTADHLVEEGKEGPSSYVSGLPLSSATFEIGVLGFNETHSFAFWVEDED